MNRVALYALSFCTNALILVFEITGGRLLAPYIGTTVGVWAGLIAVILGAMAVGYHYGGKLADRHYSREAIGLVVFTAGILALIAWSMRDWLPTLFIGSQLSPAVGAVTIGTLLFLPTVLLLAAAAPMIAKNLLENLQTSGKVVGELNAVGTSGAIVGAIATGMYLIPNFGVSTILASVAGSLLLLGILLARRYVLKLGGIAAIMLGLSLAINALPTRAEGWLGEIPTAYNRIVVTEETGGIRAVWTSPFGIQCMMYVENGVADAKRLAGDYPKAHDALIHALLSAPSRALFLGGCVGAFPRYFAEIFPNTLVDMVEIDPGMTEAAIRYFGLTTPTDNFNIIYQDARVFANTDNEPYDLVYVDAFGSAGRVPFHLMTREMFKRLAAHTAENGILVMNVHGAYAGPGALYPSVYVRTAREAFENVALYQFTDSPLTPQNLVLVASHAIPLPETIPAPAYPGLELQSVAPREDVIILTDDYAPVEGVPLEKLIAI